MNELVEEFNLIDYLSRNRFALVRSAFSSFTWRVLELNQYFFGGLGFFLIGASFFGVPWNPTRLKSELLLLLFLATFLPKLLGQFLPRYFFHYFPILLLWMGNGIEVLRNWARATFNLNIKTSTRLALGTCLFFALPSAWYLQRLLINPSLPFEYKELGIWIKKNIPQIEKEAIASRQPAVSFYSGAKILKLPYVDQIEDLLTFMAHQHARYFVVAENLDLPHRNIYQLLLDETAPLPRGVSRIYTVRGEKTATLFERVRS